MTFLELLNQLCCCNHSVNYGPFLNTLMETTEFADLFASIITHWEQNGYVFNKNNWFTLSRCEVQNPTQVFRIRVNFHGGNGLIQYGSFFETAVYFGNDILNELNNIISFSSELVEGDKISLNKIETKKIFSTNFHYEITNLNKLSLNLTDSQTKLAKFLENLDNLEAPLHTN